MPHDCTPCVIIKWRKLRVPSTLISIQSAINLPRNFTTTGKLVEWQYTLILLQNRTGDEHKQCFVIARVVVSHWCTAGYTIYNSYKHIVETPGKHRLAQKAGSILNQTYYMESNIVTYQWQPIQFRVFHNLGEMLRKRSKLNNRWRFISKRRTRDISCVHGFQPTHTASSNAFCAAKEV